MPDPPLNIVGCNVASAKSRHSPQAALKRFNCADMVPIVATRATMGTMPTTRDLREASATLRRIADATADLPDDSLADAALRDRIELAADVVDATMARPRRPHR